MPDKTNEEIEQLLLDFADVLIDMIADHPGDVGMKVVRTAQGYQLRIKPSEADIRFFIGKQGKTVNAISYLVASCAARHNMSMTLRLLEPGKEL